MEFSFLCVSVLDIPLRPPTVKTLDWFILHGCRYLPYGVPTGPQAKFTTGIRVLSGEDL